MSKALIEELRNAANPNTATETGTLWNLCDLAADRIEELEVENKNLRDWITAMYPIRPW